MYYCLNLILDIYIDKYTYMKTYHLFYLKGVDPKRVISKKVKFQEIYLSLLLTI